MKIRRIGTKLLLAVTAILAIEVGVWSYLEMTTAEKQELTEFVQTGRVHALSVARASEYGLLARNPQELARVAETFRSPGDTNLQYVAFYDERGTLVSAKEWFSDGLPIPATIDPADRASARRGGVTEYGPPAQYRFCVPVTVSRRVVEPGTGQANEISPGRDPSETASVVIARSYEQIKDRLARRQRDMLGLSAMMFTAAAVALMILSYRLVRPIRQLVESTQRVAAGDLETRVNVGGRRDELGLLADSFNRMTGELRQQRDQIVAQNRDLEQKVAARTAELAGLNHELGETNQRLQEMAITDALTGLLNRRRFVEMLEREFERSRRQGTPLALVMFDVDHFKAVNDTYGHTFGDRVLMAVADVLRIEARLPDVVARYGGEEFLVLMPDTSPADALAAAERLRRSIAARVVSDGEQGISVTVSAGISTPDPHGSGGPEWLLRTADVALYAAKGDGRNCTRTWAETACREAAPSAPPGA